MTTKGDALKEVKLALDGKLKEIEENENEKKIRRIREFAKYYTSGKYDADVAKEKQRQEEREKKDAENVRKAWKRYRHIVKLGVRNGKKVVDYHIANQGQKFIEIRLDTTGCWDYYLNIHKHKPILFEEDVMPDVKPVIPNRYTAQLIDEINYDVYLFGEIIGIIFFSIDSTHFVYALANPDFVKKYLDIIIEIKNEFKAFKPSYVRNRLIKRGKKIAKDLSREQIKGLSYLIDELAKI